MQREEVETREIEAMVGEELTIAQEHVDLFVKRGQFEDGQIVVFVNIDEIVPWEAIAGVA